MTSRLASTRTLIILLGLLSLATQAQADELSTFCHREFRTFPGAVQFAAVYGERDPCNYNEDVLQPLASTTKILTGIAAFSRLDNPLVTLLDPERPFNPMLTWREVIPGERSVITQLELVGDGGDELWDNARYAEAVALLKAAGVTEIHGEIRARASDPRWNSINRPTWPAEDVTQKMECKIYFPRAFKLGPEGCPQVLLSRGVARWSNPALNDTPIRFEEPEAPFSFHFEMGPSENEASGALVIRGRPPARFNVLFRDSAKIATLRLRAALAGKFIFNTREHSISSTQEVMTASLKTQTLEKLLAHFLKSSDNFEGEFLLRQIGIKSYAYDALPGRFGHDALHDGKAAIFESAKRLGAGIHERNLKITDGCGLAPQTAATPQAMMAALVGIRNHPRFQEFRELLVKPGAVPGTLRHRFNGLSGRLRAKTGTLPHGGVHNLAGFMLTSNANVADAASWNPFVALSLVAPTVPEIENVGEAAERSIDRVTTAYAGLLRRPRPLPRP